MLNVNYFMDRSEASLSTLKRVPQLLEVWGGGKVAESYQIITKQAIVF